MRHPIEEYNERQANLLASLPNEDRQYMARMFRIGNAVYCYYNRAKDLAVFGHRPQEPAEDLLEWLEPQPGIENRCAVESLLIY